MENPAVCDSIMSLQGESPLVFDQLVAPSPALRAAVDGVCDRDPVFGKIEAELGRLTVRQMPPGFASLVRIILGQQLSAKAAQAIFLRLYQQLELTPELWLGYPEAQLRQMGFSQTKVATCRRAATAILEGSLTLTGDGLDDSAISAQFTRIKGIGSWTAAIYLLFCLERLSSFPAADLALQVSYQTLKDLPDRPAPKVLLALVQPFWPYGGAAAHLLWHHYRVCLAPSRLPKKP